MHVGQQNRDLARRRTRKTKVRTERKRERENPPLDISGFGLTEEASGSLITNQNEAEAGFKNIPTDDKKRQLISEGIAPEDVENLNDNELYYLNLHVNQNTRNLSRAAAEQELSGQLERPPGSERPRKPPGSKPEGPEGPPRKRNALFDKLNKPHVTKHPVTQPNSTKKIGESLQTVEEVFDVVNESANPFGSVLSDLNLPGLSEMKGSFSKTPSAPPYEHQGHGWENENEDEDEDEDAEHGQGWENENEEWDDDPQGQGHGIEQGKRQAWNQEIRESSPSLPQRDLGQFPFGKTNFGEPRLELNRSVPASAPLLKSPAPEASAALAKAPASAALSKAPAQEAPAQALDPRWEEKRDS